jgi:hypothetical protein
MKLHTLLLLSVIIITSVVYSQTAYNGPAKKPYDDFWKIIAEINESIKQKPDEPLSSNKLSSAYNKINMVKIKDKDFNTDAMEAEVEKLEKLLQQWHKDKRTAYKVSVQQQGAVTGLLKEGEPKIRSTGNKETDIASFKTSLVQFSESAAQILAGDKAAYLSAENSVQARANAVKNLADMYISRFSKATDELGIYNYYDLMGMQEYWSAMKKFYPANNVIVEAYSYVNAAMQKAGSEELVLQKIKQNKSDALAKAKMPAAVVKDEGLERFIKNLFPSLNQLKSFTPVKVHIMSADWTIDRNQLTGVIIQRSKHAVVGAKKAEGTCWLLNIWVAQDYTGNGYGATRQSGDNIIAETACANLQ